MPYAIQAALGAAAVVLGAYLAVTGRLEGLYPARAQQIWKRDDRWFIAVWRWMSVRGIPLIAMIVWGIALIVD